MMPIIFVWMVINLVTSIVIMENVGGVALNINDRIHYLIGDNFSDYIDNCIECINMKLLLKQSIIVNSIHRQ